MIILDLFRWLLLTFALMILLRSLASWLPSIHHHDLVQQLFRITDLVLEPIRRLLPPIGGLDLSPMIALIVIYAILRVLASIG